MNMLPNLLSGRRLLAEWVLVLGAMGWCGAFLLLRAYHYQSFGYRFLIWNLFLAGLPFVFSTAMQLVRTRGARWTLGACWIVFLPNAPYIVTDLVHLRRIAGPWARDLWYWMDLMLLLSAACAGVLCFFLSLRHVHRLVERATQVWIGALFAFSVVFASAFGVMLGRIHRLNSWDVVHQPLIILRDITDLFFNPLANRLPWALTIGLGTLLAFGYATLCCFRMPDPPSAVD